MWKIVINYNKLITVQLNNTLLITSIYNSILIYIINIIKSILLYKKLQYDNRAFISKINKISSKINLTRILIGS